MLISPALIPNKQIFRHDPNTDSDYYVYFSKETVQKASELYLKHNNHHKATYQHQDRVSGVLTVESWIIEDTKLDKSTLYGYSLPVGTWMVKLSISNDEMWSKIKSGELRGLSIEGYFTSKFEAMNKKESNKNNMKPTQEQILSAINQLVRENKTELKAEKIELGLVDDLKKAVNKIEKNNSTLKKEAQNLKKAGQTFESVYQKARDKTEDAFDSALSLFDSAREVIPNAARDARDIKTQAKELGLNAKDIPIIKQFEAAEKEHDSVTDKLSDELGKLRNIFAD
jgi:hypothetical protein